jgi:hypothetical protein
VRAPRKQIRHHSAQPEGRGHRCKASSIAWADFYRMSGGEREYVSCVMLTEACSNISESIFGLRLTRHEGIMFVVEREVSL